MIGESWRRNDDGDFCRVGALVIAAVHSRRDIEILLTCRSRCIREIQRGNERGR